jgi:hypothetical protein
MALQPRHSKSQNASLAGRNKLACLPDTKWRQNEVESASTKWKTARKCVCLSVCVIDHSGVCKMRFYKCVRLFCLFPTSQTKSRTHACCRRPCLFHTQPNNQVSFESCVIEQAKPCAGMHTICLQHFALQHKECKSGLMGKIQKNNWTHLNNLTVCS